MEHLGFVHILQVGGEKAESHGIESRKIADMSDISDSLFPVVALRVVVGEAGQSYDFTVLIQSSYAEVACLDELDDAHMVEYHVSFFACELLYDI